MNDEELDYLTSEGIQVLEKIASGGNGEIFIVFSNQYFSKFILKKIRENIFNEGEIECMMRCSDPSIVALYKYYKFGGYVYLLMELCKCDLEKYIKSAQNISEKDTATLIKSLILAVKACHDHHIAHRDIKPSNFLIDNYQRVKIADFGLSSIFGNNHQSNKCVGTIYFMAPELIRRQAHDSLAADIWALGVTIYFIATGRYPFYSAVPDELIAQIFQGQYQTDCIADPRLVQLIAACLSPDPQSRPTVNQLLQMDYIACLDTDNSKKLLQKTGSVLSGSRLILKPNVPSVIRARVRTPKMTKYRASCSSVPSQLIPILN